MSNAIKHTREHLARAKAYFTRHETERALLATVSALKIMASENITGPGKLETDNALHEVVTLLNRTEELRTHFPNGITYRKGIEKPLYAVYSNILKEIQGTTHTQTYEEILARKQKIDKNLNYGKKLLQAGRIKDAQELFDEVTSLYEDEHTVFRLMGKACLEVKQTKTALRYLKKAMKVDPFPAIAIDLAILAYKAEGNMSMAAKLEAQRK